MGRPRIKVMDGSTPEAEEKKQKTAKKNKIIQDSAAGDGEKGIPTRSRSEETSEDARRDIEPAGPASEEKQESGAADRKQKSQKPGKAKPRSKKYQEAAKDLDRSKLYPLEEAVDMVKKLSYAKFNATLEAHITTAQTGIVGYVSLPYAKGRQLRILCFGPSTTSQLEGVIFGTDSTIEEINKGKVDFDLIITTPDWMPKLAKVAKILGPRGLMPNPKNNTIVSNEAGLKKCVESFQAGKTEYRTEPKAPVIHVALGKLNQPNEELVTNIKTLLQALGKSRIKKITLSPTMGPSVKLDLSSF